MMEDDVLAEEAGDACLASSSARGPPGALT